MDWTCPVCGSRSWHYDRASMQNKCDGCGRLVDDRQQNQQLMQYDRTVANARDHLRAGNWHQTVSLLQPLLRDRPAEVRLHQLILQAATREYRDFEMNDSALRTAASEAWNRLARLNGLTGEMLRYSQKFYAKRMEKMTAIRNRFLTYVLIASVLILLMSANMGEYGEGTVVIMGAVTFWALYKAVKVHPSGAIRALSAPRPDWSDNPFLWKLS